MPDYPIVDSHVHLTDPATLRYPWIAGVPALDRAWSLGDLDAAAPPARIAQIVFVEVDVHADDRLDEARWVARLAARDARIGGMVAAVAIERGGAIAAEVDRLQDTGLLSGVRRLIQGEADPAFCARAEVIEGVRWLGGRDLPFDICCYHHQLPAVARMVLAAPDTRFVLDHLGKPAVRTGALDPWRADIDRLAACPNVWCKISGLATEADHAAWSADDLLPYIRHARDAFGPGRVLFGGDWPVSTLAIVYPDWIRLLDRAFADWPEAARAAFWGGTARQVYSLPAIA